MFICPSFVHVCKSDLTDALLYCLCYPCIKVSLCNQVCTGAKSEEAALNAARKVSILLLYAFFQRLGAVTSRPCESLKHGVYVHLTYASPILQFAKIIQKLDNPVAFKVSLKGSAHLPQALQTTIASTYTDYAFPNWGQRV